MQKLRPVFLAISIFLTILTADVRQNAIAVFSNPFIGVDQYVNETQTATVTLVNERMRTHHWQYTLSDESVLACVGTHIQGQNTEFIFEGYESGVCDVIFEYRRTSESNQATLITEVYRFYVDNALNVSYEHVFFHTNES